MADYKDVLRRALAGLPEKNAVARRAMYEKGRAALVGQLRAITPPLPAREITQHRLQLEADIRQVESEISVDFIMQSLKVGREEARQIYAVKYGEPLPVREAATEARRDRAMKTPGAQSDSSDDLIAQLAQLMAEDARRPERPEPVFQIVEPIRVTTPDPEAIQIVLHDLVRIPVPTESAVVDEAEPEDGVDAIGDEVRDAADRLYEVIASEPQTANDRPGPVPQVVRTRTVRIYSPPPEAAAPLQRTDAVGFKASTEGLDVGPVQTYEKLQVTPDQAEAYAALREEATSVLAMGTNLLGDAAVGVRKLTLALPQDIGEARLFTVWQAGNRLRRLHSAHLAVAGQGDAHLAALDPAVAEMIGGLCDEFNNFAALDPGLRQRDAWRLPPTQRPATITEEFDAIDPVVNQAIEANIVTPEAVSEVRAEIPAELTTVPEIVIPEIDLANRTRRNFIAALIEGAFAAAKKIALGGSKEVAHATRIMADGLYSNVGTGVGISMIWIVVKNAPALTVFAAQTLNSPQAVAAINWIVQVFGP